MKKILSIVLAAILVFSVMTPVTVFAENGPYPNNFDNIDLDNLDFTNLKVSGIVFFDFNATSENMYDAIGLVYPAQADMPLPKIFSGASYNKDTNTLTLKNVNSKTAILILSGMGDDFKINLIGYNEFAAIMSMGMEWGGSVTLTGSGELVIGRSDEALLTGIDIEADDTASVFHVEDTVKLKVYSHPDYYSDAVIVSGSTVTDPQEIIKLGGAVKGDTPVFEKYTVNFYEQAEAYDTGWNDLGMYDVGLEKDGSYYIAMEHYDETTYDYTGKYNVYSIAYDELLGCYTATDYANGEPISLKGFTKLTEFDAIYDAEKGYYIGFSFFNEDAANYKSVFYPMEKEPFDLCVDENGTKYGFWQDTYEDDDGTKKTDTYVYNLIDHPTYGLVAVEDESKTSLDGLTPLKIGEKDYANCSISSDLVINNGGSVVEPSMIKGIELKNTNEGVKISWKSNSKAEQYKVYRKAPTDENWKLLYTLGADKTSYIDKTTKSGKEYIYTVRGGNFVGWGDYNEDGVSITHTATPQATANNTSKGIYLKWTKIAGAEKYRIYRQTEGSTKWKLLDTTKKTTFTDKTAKSGTKYYYRVRAVAGGDMSSYEVVGRYYLSTPKLTSVRNTASGAKVSWGKVEGAQGYKIYRKTSEKGDWKLIHTTTSNKKSYYTDKTAKSGKTYYYSVQAYYSKTKSTYNKTGLKLKYVEAPKVKVKEYSKSIKLSWNDIDNADKYAIYRKASGESKWTKITTTEKLSYKDTAVRKGKTYSYRVRAVDGKVKSGFRTLKIVK